MIIRINKNREFNLKLANKIEKEYQALTKIESTSEIKTEEDNNVENKLELKTN